jgi:hypothetical protein
MDPGSHVEFQISTKNTNLVEDHPMMYQKNIFNSNLGVMIPLGVVLSSLYSTTHLTYIVAFSDLLGSNGDSEHVFSSPGNQHQKHKSGRGPSNEHFW